MTSVRTILTFVCLSVAPASAQYRVVYNFPPSIVNANHPSGTLRADFSGLFFGQTNGFAFELTPGPHGYTEQNLPPGAPGGAEWTPDAKGNYFTASGDNIVEASLSPSGMFYQRNFFTFGVYATDGMTPSSNLVFDTAGNLYGTTFAGGLYNCGTVFELALADNGSGTEHILYSFEGNNFGNTDGLAPTTGLIIDSAGNLFGTTRLGGPPHIDGGTVFELTRQPGGLWTEAVIYYFTPAVENASGDLSPIGLGSNPSTGLVLDNQGNLYGGTYTGTESTGPAPSDTSTEGTIYKLSPGPSGTWTAHFTHLNCQDQVACYLNSLPVLDSLGNLYSTMASDSVFQLTPQSQQTFLHNFPASPSDGSGTGGVVLSHGSLYGATFYGGPTMDGTVYEIQGLAPASVNTITSIVATPETNLVAGESITLTATVTASSGPAIPTGTVTFVDPAGGSIKVLLAAGKAVYSGRVPPAGSYSVYASYSGDSSFAGSRSSTITDSVRTP